jgi:cyclopropane-fatty-acyl-phospholipid synthase
MRAISLTDLTPHYPETLRCWRANFESAAARLAEIGYDERFRRLWRMYLCYCEAGFIERRIRAVQIALAKPRSLEHARVVAAGEVPPAIA